MSTYTCTHTSTNQIWKHGANSSGTEATKSRGFTVEISTSLHGEFLFCFVLLADRTTVCFLGSPTRKMAKKEFEDLGSMFLYWRLGIWADSGRSVV